MSIYRYPAGSLIDEVRIVSNAAGGERAYLRASKGVDNEACGNVIRNLQKTGYECIPMQLEGKPALEVRQIKKGEKLLKHLHEQQYISGKPEIETLPSENLSFTDKVKKRMLQASGAVYLIGDACYTWYGYEKERWEDVCAGLAYFLGTSSLLLFGRNDQSDLQVKDLSKALSEHWQQEGHKVLENSSAFRLTHEGEKDWKEKTKEFLQRHPAESMNTMFGVAGAFIITSAARHEAFKKPPPDATQEQIAKIAEEARAGRWDIGLGAMTMTSGAISALVKEKAPDPDAPPPTGLRWAWSLIEARPLAVAGIGYIISTLCHANSSRIAWNNALVAQKEALRKNIPLDKEDANLLKSIPFRATFVAANLLAEAMLAVSSKGHGHGVKSDDSVDQTVLAVAADLIAKHPEQEREVLVTHMAEYLGRPDVLATKDVDVTAKLREQVEAMTHNPWAKGMPTTSSKPDTWQQKVSLSTAATSDHQVSI